MNEESLRALLDDVRQGQASTDDALERLRRLPFEDMGFAHLDSHRALRSGFPEVVLCSGKRTEHVVAIMARLAEGPGPILATRAAPEVFDAVRAALPAARYHDLARAIVYEPTPLPRRPGRILVISAGTADLPVAEEAAVTAEVMGNTVERLYDVGVAGLHRLLGHIDQVMSADVLIVAAGMEGALPSVVGGLVRRPVIAVPTSVGYGASFGGLAALLGMLNSCAAGVTVVNIDNGFGAGFAASLINTRPAAGA
ncbi:nickel pincer cofactor biosynthesis protein LarB [Oscillochloris sp. ZM17-4]|uniref:nickel pincer cofactor biosynthesis protein LarB n=1 Tax=Oscillochloris sp. ZM17-4 TaxID=2866714 RepID=UPI001C736F48|nr:nickel pincer cofactor biosynthesis protein LarB [Oscillochloris sp. ZM17-4]MBX0328030.1 nickel pincer cofactor biosynthesis protein LarB [Oscillochloris sp. ZM17-4]